MRRLAFLFLLAGCTEFPELEGTVAPDVTGASFMEFLTVDELAALNADTPVAAPTSPLAGRLARLRARAAALRGPIFTSGDRARLSGMPG